MSWQCRWGSVCSPASTHHRYPASVEWNSSSRHPCPHLMLSSASFLQPLCFDLGQFSRFSVGNGIPFSYTGMHACTHACTHARTHARTHAHTHSNQLVLRAMYTNLIVKHYHSQYSRHTFHTVLVTCTLLMHISEYSFLIFLIPTNMYEYFGNTNVHLDSTSSHPRLSSM